MRKTQQNNLNSPRFADHEEPGEISEHKISLASTPKILGSKKAIQKRAAVRENFVLTGKFHGSRVAAQNVEKAPVEDSFINDSLGG